MNNVKIISIRPEYEHFLTFLYPDYTRTDSLSMVSRFIIRKDLKHKSEADLAKYHYSNCVIVSNIIYDEVWDEEKLCDLALAFARNNLKCRKRTCNVSKDNPDTFVDDLVKFMFVGIEEEEQEDILELFNSYGSGGFNTLYMEFCDRYSPGLAFSSMITFVSKVIGDASSIYYKRKKMVLEKKIKDNFEKAIDLYDASLKDDYGLAQLAFLSALVRNT